MSIIQQRQPTGATNHSQILAAEARLNRIHRLFKTQFNVTEPSLILEPYLFLGNCISAHDINRLSKLGIRYVLNVAIRDVEVCPYYSNDVRTLTIDLRDDDRENILRAFDQAFAFIDEAKRVKSRVLVHCSHGQSRSPAIVLGYLMRTYHVSLEQCLVHVIKARPCVLPNDGFLKQLILYDRFLVDRRRQQQELALAKAVNAATSATEIPIQYHPPVAAQPAQSTAPIILAPPQCPAVEASNATSMSSVDSSSLGQSSTSSILTSASADSIRVIPIQVPSKAVRSDKVEPIPIKKVPVRDTLVVEEPKKNINKLPDKPAPAKKVIVPSKSTLEVTTSNHAAPSKKRQNTPVANIVKRPPSQSPRSHSAHLVHTQVNYYNHSTPLSSAQQWNTKAYYPTNHRTSKEQPRTKYITEIYDKATNRFIPTSC